MKLVNKEVIHETFGKGHVLDYDDSYININFESGDKKFIFPDAFAKHVKFTDKKSTDIIKKKLKEREKERKKEAIELEKQKIIEQEERDLIKQREAMKNQKVHPKIQSVFWCEPGEEEEIFKDWRVFTGKIKSGVNKGLPRPLIRMNQNSACLITKRASSEPEENRQILGVFMAEEFFNGRLCEDGYINAHPEHRLKLSKKESEKMLFWNYYIDEKFPDKMTWNSGRQRYFDNIWMAQILQDIVFLRNKAKEREQAQKFYEYFCRMTRLDRNQIPKADGPLIRNQEDS